MTEIKDKISHVLEETRVVLPGTQAFLGFQFVAIFSTGFDKIPPTLKTLHLLSMLLVILSSICLMTSAAYHRIVERGEDTENFHRFASGMVISALIFLAFGVCVDVYVILEIVNPGADYNLPIVIGLILVFLLAWFFLPMYHRYSKK